MAAHRLGQVSDSHEVCLLIRLKPRVTSASSIYLFSGKMIMMKACSEWTCGLWRTAQQGSLLIFLAMTASLSGANQQADLASNPDPLRPAETSSPRDTLRTFLTNVGEVGETLRRGELNAKGVHAYLRATKTLDLRSTPDSNEWSVRTERILLLKELLDRIELPPDSEIPGDLDVAERALTQWSIPGTAITIVQITDGQRAREFLFSADTVEQLHRLYAHAKHLPTKTGEGGLYEEWIRSENTERAREQRIRNRLKQVNTSSPRSTLEGFLESVNEAYALVMAANEAQTAVPPTMTRREAREADTAAVELLRRAVNTLDLSQVPEVLKEDIGNETALQLKEIFDRMWLPPMDAVPDARMVADERDKEQGAIRWRYPYTEIEIVEVSEGERQGEFLFSAATVDRVGEFYDAVKQENYRPDVDDLDWVSPGKSEGFFEYYISTLGSLVQQSSYLGRLVADLPAWMNTMRGGQTLWQWIATALFVLVLALAAILIHRITKRAAKKMSSPVNAWLITLTPMAIAMLADRIAGFIDREINATGDLAKFILTGGSAIVIGMMAWAAFLLSNAIAETLIARPSVKEKSSEAALLRIGARIFGSLIAAWVVIDGLRALGADLIPVLAGLGVGGLALALAAQTTVANFIGGLILYINKPVRVGEYCRYGEDPNPGWQRTGTVEEIGLLSTRLRGLDRTVTTIPNAEFSKMHIVNLTKRDERLLRTTLQLRYETTPDQLRDILIRLRELLLGHPMVTPDPARVRFVGYAAYSLDVEIFAYLRCVNQDTFLAVQEDLLLRIADIVSEAGSGFAFPSQTAYIARDAGLDNEQKEAAESRVDGQRALGKLPFPYFEDEDREELEDILDYPSKGSTGYRPRSGLTDT